MGELIIKTLKPYDCKKVIIIRTELGKQYFKY